MRAVLVPSELDRYKLEVTIHEDYIIETTYGIDNTTELPVNTRWVEGERLGSGGFGVVSLQQTAKGQLRAVKRLPRHLRNANYSRELSALSQLIDCQDLFVLFLGWYEDRHSVFIVMEYMEHGDLDQYLKTPDIQINAREITRQLLAGLTILHERKICHRDLKPQNILVASLDPIKVKIADFGSSKIRKNTRLHTQIGAQGYIAPEILGLLSGISLRDSYTDAVDMWALGCVVHKILTSRLPFTQVIDRSNTTSSGIISNIESSDLGKVDMISLLQFCSGKTKFPVEILEQSQVDPNGVAFIMSLLVADPKSRVSARIALRSPWLLEGYKIEQEEPPNLTSPCGFRSPSDLSTPDKPSLIQLSFIDYSIYERIFLRLKTLGRKLPQIISPLVHGRLALGLMLKPFYYKQVGTGGALVKVLRERNTYQCKKDWLRCQDANFVGTARKALLKLGYSRPLRLIPYISTPYRRQTCHE